MGKGRAHRWTIGAAVLGSWLCAGVALAARPSLASEATYGRSGGGVLVHYATTGADAPPAADADADGVPDYVAMVAQSAEEGLAHFVAMGFRRPVSDGALGGDARVDVYLINMSTADGHAGTDSCVGNVCIGYAEVENDFAGASYGSLLEAVRSVVPHELFHLVQMSYASGHTAAWSEGSAVWAVEELYGNGNADFERFLPSFLTKSFRPFERPGGGFGDGYPYGAALWPYFLSRRHDPGVVVKAWEASATQPFLDACQTALVARGSSVDDEFTIMTRWNLFTGDRAAGGKYPDAASWRQVPKEMPISTGSGKVYVDGLSAAYVDVTFSGEKQELLVAPTGGIKVAAWVVADGGGYDEGVELKSSTGGLVTTLNPGTYTLVVTGLTRAISATEVKVELRQAPIDSMPDPDDQEEDGGGCQSTAPSGGWMIAFAIVSGLWRKRRRAAIST